MVHTISEVAERGLRVKSKDWTTWALLGVIAVSICVAIPPLNELEVYPGCGRMCQYRIGLGGLAGVIGGCLALLVWRIRKDRGTQVRDVVSWVSLIVIVALAGWATFWWTPGATGDIYWWFLGLPPFTVVLFVYLVLLGHLIQRALGRRILGLPVAVLLVGLVVELLLFEILAGFDWPVLLSMALGTKARQAQRAGIHPDRVANGARRGRP
jgi:hypothetical protein